MSYDPTPALEAIDAIAPEMEKLGPKPPWALPHHAFEWHKAMEAAAEPLRTSLEGMPPFKDWQNPMMNVGAGSNGVHPQFLAPLLAELIAEKGPQFAKDAVRTLLSSDRAEAAWVTIAFGFDVDGELDLGSGLSVTMMQDEEANRRFKEWSVPWHIRVNQRPAVFRAPVTITPVLHRSDDASDAPDSTAVMNVMNRVVEEVSALSALGDASPVLEERHISFADPHLQALARVGRYTSALEVVPARSATPIKLDAKAETYLTEFRQLRPKLRSRILTILDRLALAKRRSNPTNQALDACIALEMLLTGKGDSQGGIVHRLGTRAALYLGVTLEERRQLRKAVSAAYGLRSRAAHGGTNHKDDDTAVATSAIHIADRLVRRVVADGSEVDWQELELNPPPLSG